MKILFLSHAQYITVAFPKLMESAEVLVEMGHEVTVAVTHKKNRWRPERFTRNGVRYILSPSILPGKLRHGADLYDAFRRILLLRKLHFDIIHAIDSRPSVILPALYLQRKIQAPLILEWSDWFGKGGTISERSGWLYNHTLGHIETMFEERFRMKADGATVVSKKLFDRLISMGFPAKKIHIHRMGCLTDRFSNLSKTKCRKELQIPSDRKMFAYFGRIFPRDLDLLISSFQSFNEKTGHKYFLYLVGDIPPPDLMVGDHIQYEGRVPDETYLLLMGAVDACLLPMHLTLANLARWPSKFTDYLAAGKPVVTTAVSDFEEIFRMNSIGILANGDEVQDFTDALTTFAEHPENWEAWGLNAKKYASDHLSWNIINQKLVSFYQDIQGNC